MSANYSLLQPEIFSEGFAAAAFLLLTNNCQTAKKMKNTTFQYSLNLMGSVYLLNRNFCIHLHTSHLAEYLVQLFIFGQIVIYHLFGTAQIYPRFTCGQAVEWFLMLLMIVRNCYFRAAFDLKVKTAFAWLGITTSTTRIGSGRVKVYNWTPRTPL